MGAFWIWLGMFGRGGGGCGKSGRRGFRGGFGSVGVGLAEGVIVAEEGPAKEVFIVVECFLDWVGDIWSWRRRLWRIGKAEAAQQAKCDVRVNHRKIRAALVLFFFNLVGLLWRRNWRSRFLLWLDTL